MLFFGFSQLLFSQMICGTQMFCLTGRLTGLPGEREQEQERERKRDPTLLFFYARGKEREPGSGNKSSVQCKRIIEVSQPLHLK